MLVGVVVHIASQTHTIFMIGLNSATDITTGKVFRIRAMFFGIWKKNKSCHWWYQISLFCDTPHAPLIIILDGFWGPSLCALRRVAIWRMDKLHKFNNLIFHIAACSCSVHYGWKYIFDLLFLRNHRSFSFAGIFDIYDIFLLVPCIRS